MSKNELKSVAESVISGNYKRCGSRVHEVGGISCGSSYFDPAIYSYPTVEFILNRETLSATIPFNKMNVKAWVTTPAELAYLLRVHSNSKLYTIDWEKYRMVIFKGVVFVFSEFYEKFGLFLANGIAEHVQKLEDVNHFV